MFELPDVIAVASERGAEDLTLVFGAPLKFELAEARASLPPAVKAIEMAEQAEGVAVRFVLNGTVDVRSFREDNNYVVDIGASDAKDAAIVPPKPDDPLASPAGESLKAAAASIEAPQTIAAKPQPAMAPKPAPPPAAERKSPQPRRRSGSAAPRNRSR